jgi:hypothetical protein
LWASGFFSAKIMKENLITYICSILINKTVSRLTRQSKTSVFLRFNIIFFNANKDKYVRNSEFRKKYKFFIAC